MTLRKMIIMLKQNLSKIFILPLILFLHSHSYAFGSVTAAKDYLIGAKILVLAGSKDEDFGTLQFTQEVLRSYQIPFEIKSFIKNGVRDDQAQLNLYDGKGIPKYYAIITTSSNLSYKNNANQYASALTQKEWRQLQSYEKRFNVRRVSLYSYPSAELGVKNLVTKDHNKKISLKTTVAMANLDKGLKKDIKIELQDAWFYLAQLNNEKIARPFLYYEKLNSKLIAGVVTSSENQAEQMHFFFTQSKWSKASQLLSGTWLHWVTKGLYVGKRRIYLSAHVDDLFLMTDLHILNPTPGEVAPIHRLSDKELAFYTKWQKGFRTKIKNKNFKTEMAFNGKGVAQYFERFENAKVDPLMQQSIIDYNQYYWVNHTYSHANLNQIDYKSTFLELENNRLFSDALIKIDPSLYSPHSLVTPHISGLFNAAALNAMKDFKIKYIVGDNTRVKIRPPHPYTAIYTTNELNGADGILIMPRYATEMYFDAHDKTLLTEKFNIIYHSYYKRRVPFAEIMQKEASRVSAQLLKYDHAPYMFHQSNLHVFKDGTQKISLLSKWLDVVTDEVLKVSTLPILNLKMEEMAQIFEQKVKYNNCQFNIIFHFKDKVLTEVSGDAKHACHISISGYPLPLHKKNNSLQFENYGQDRTLTFKTSKNASFIYDL